MVSPAKRSEREGEREEERNQETQREGEDGKFILGVRLNVKLDTCVGVQQEHIVKR